MAAFQKCETLGDGAHLWQIIQGQPEWEAMLDVAKKGKHRRLMLVGPRALEQLVSLERLTYVAYFVLLTCF